MIRRLIFSALTAVLAVGGVGCKASPGVPIAILMYHRIGDAPDDLWTVSAVRLRSTDSVPETATLREHSAQISSTAKPCRQSPSSSPSMTGT